MELFKKIIKKTLKLLVAFCKSFIKWLRVKSKEYPFFTKSLILHFIVVIFVSGVIPSCEPDVKEPKVITVDIMPMQIEQEVQKPKLVKIPKPKIVPKKIIEQNKKPKPKKELPKPKQLKKTQQKPKKKEKIEEVKKEDLKKKESPLPNIKKPEEKKEEKQEDKKEDKKPTKEEEEQKGRKTLLKDLEKKESLDQLIEEIDDKALKDEEEVPEVKQLPDNEQEEKKFVPDAAFVSEIMSIVQGQITQCWSIPIGAKNVDNMSVVLRIKLDNKGKVNSVKIVDSKKYASDDYFRVLADSAVWAVKECSPLRGLPEDKHEFWKEIEFTFNPSMVL
jgi:outer membrane biosynthesis protein TonB